MSPPSQDKDPTASAIFAEWLASREDDEDGDFERLMRDHAARADDLEQLHSDWRLARAFLGRLRAPASLGEDVLFEQLRERFARGFDSHLEHRSDPVASGPWLGRAGQERAEDASSELFRRLSGRTGSFGRYQLEGEIARGGMGAILKIWDGDLRRHLAMKVILGQADVRSSGVTPPVAPRLVARFLEEAQVTGQLDHPGIVPVHELGLDPEGRLYFTMKLVKGRSLKEVFDRLTRGDEDWTRTKALGVLLKVCEAMAYAHDKGVIHRDLKPGNIMVGKFGEVHVMDWGLARILDQHDEKDIRIREETHEVPGLLRSDRSQHRSEMPESPLCTMDGDVVGTPAYMPPEQANGRVHEIGPHSDVYALGAMLYHLIAGRMPYAIKDAALDNHAIWELVKNGPPTSIAKLSPQTPAELVAICDKAMARDWRERYRDMSELAADLSAYHERRVVAAYQTGAWAETKKWIERNRPLAASLAAGALALLAGVIVSLSLKQEADASARVAEEKEGIATQRTNDVLSLSAIQDLADLVVRADQLWPADPGTIPAYDRWLEDARLLIEGRPAEPEHGIKSRPSLAQLEGNLAELRSRALPQQATARDLDRATHPRSGELEKKKAELTWTARMLGLDPWPRESDVERKLATESLPSEAMALNQIAWDLVARDTEIIYGQEVRAYLIARRALASATAAQSASCRDTLAWALYGIGRLEESLSEDQRAVAESDVARRAKYNGGFAKLTAAIGRWKGAAALSMRRVEHETLAREVQALEGDVGRRTTWDFADSEDRWWHAQLSKLVTDLAALRNPKTGLDSDGVSEAHGWGVRRRREFAFSIEHRSMHGKDASKSWSEAIDAIATSPSYEGLSLSPQLGLLPIGLDAESGLYEFAHLQTGEPARRGPNGKLELTESTGLVLVLLPAGSFFMGAQRTDPQGQNFDSNAHPNESPVRRMTMDAFFLSKYEMTQSQWLRVAGRNPSYYGPSGYSSECNAANKAWSGLHPVEQVSWTDCARLMHRLSLSLPTEAQWEFGCRALTTTPYWSGNSAETLRQVGNVADASGKDSGSFGALAESWDDGNIAHAEIGSYRANAFGLSDMHGNVWEWTSDLFAKYSQPGHPGEANIAGSDRDQFVLRGGSFQDAALNARSATRTGSPPGFRQYGIGVRPARPVTH